MEWRTLDSAPKDGSRVLLWDGIAVFEGLWNDRWQTAQTLSPRPWTSAWMPLPRPPRKGDEHLNPYWYHKRPLSHRTGSAQLQAPDAQHQMNESERK